MSTIHIYPNPIYPAGRAEYNDKSYPAVVGKSGVVPADTKKEGDKATPDGEYGILGGYYRPDAIEKPVAQIELQPISPDDIWVDDQADPRYNSLAKAADASDVSHEKLYRDDHLYNIVLDLDFNRTPAVPGKGSAIFVHVARDQNVPANTPTDGCIAFRETDLLEILRSLPQGGKISIHTTE